MGNHHFWGVSFRECFPPKFLNLIFHHHLGKNIHSLGGLVPKTLCPFLGWQNTNQNYVVLFATHFQIRRSQIVNPLPTFWGFKKIHEAPFGYLNYQLKGLSSCRKPVNSLLNDHERTTFKTLVTNPLSDNCLVDPSNGYETKPCIDREGSIISKKNKKSE